jgi:hypothetical protein
MRDLRSRALFQASLLVLVTTVGVACGFTVLGSTESANGDGTDGGGAREASPGSPPSIADGAPSLGDKTDDDAGGESDGGVFDDAGCGPTTFTENFANGLGGWTTYGPVQVRMGGPQGNFARLIDDQDSTAAGMFWLPKPKAKEIHVTFRYRVDVPSGTDYIGDGFTFTWLTDNGAQVIGKDAISGQALGLWPGVTGYAWILDAWENSGIDDEQAPFFSFIHVENGRGRPGNYPWHVKKSVQYTYSVFDTWWPVDIKIEAGKATAVVSTKTVVSDAPVDTNANITGIGFTAATGGAYPMRISVDTVTFELKNAVCN